jgi:hypothetical protein
VARRRHDRLAREPLRRSERTRRRSRASARCAAQRAVDRLDAQRRRTLVRQRFDGARVLVRESPRGRRIRP